ncbi:class I SAM-dependent methyltransferase [Aspergillus tanneri]|nr:uncharacterized protein ATNIH1004_006748 [Aspergillus tanneri]KAA8645329.1 hypothetical protein ATNIH1004_006748 [Aspergillus tanneri]
MINDIAQFYDSIANIYDNGFAHNQGLLDFIERVKPHLPRSAHILDIGCGTGHPVSTTLAASGHRITGVDLSPAMVALSQERVPEGRFVVADMREYEHSVAEDQPDAIFSVFAMFRLGREEIEELVKKWASWLNVNGLLCIATMAADDCDPEKIANGYDIDGLCARAVRQQFMKKEVFHTLFTRRGWTEILHQNGLEELDVRSALFVPPKSMSTSNANFYYIIARKRV